MLSRRADGRFDLTLSQPERALLANLAPQLRELLATGTDPALRRLYPTAYPDDDEQQAEYQALTHDDLLQRRLDDLDLLEEQAGATDLSEDDVVRWMKAINGLRLVLGTRLDVSEDTRSVDDDDPDAPAHHLYEYLGHLLHGLLAAL